MFRRLLIVLSFCCMLSACCGVREAQQTVATADSLRVNRGVAYGNGVPTSNMQRGVGDSIALAQAYTTFGRVQHIYPNDYARACYYYGRLLRNHGDQVAAMQAFINGSHAPYWHRLIPLPQFTDYHILGRIYSNMGTMCHLVDAFELSYEMYEHASECMLKANDSTLYYYLLNDMAYELAEQNLLDQTLSQLNTISRNCTNSDVLTKTLETKARLFLNVSLYDSAIYAAKELYARGYYASSGYVTIAQAYWNLQQYDSALHYAKIVMSMPCAAEQDRYNMLYILAYNDNCSSKIESQQRSEEREDIDKDILDPLHRQLAQAVTILQSDLNDKPYYVHLALMAISVVFIGILTWFSITRIKRHRIQLYVETERERQKQQDLYLQQLELEKRNSAMRAEQCEQRDILMKDIERNRISIRNLQNWENDLSWKQHEQVCKIADKNFNLIVRKLKEHYQLNEKEIHLCILVIIGDFNDKQLAELLIYGNKSIRTIKRNVALKLDTTSANLRKTLLEIAVGISEISSPK